MSSPSSSRTHSQPIIDNLRNVVASLVPESMITNIACYVLYDHHPTQASHCDIAICTKSLEVKEYYNREEVSSIALECVTTPNKMRILRNSNCYLYYLVTSNEEISILSCKDELKVLLTLGNVDYYDIDDFGLRGMAYLKIVLKDDAVPLIFDDKFESLRDRASLMDAVTVTDTSPICNQLRRKLSHVHYNIKCNEKTHRELIDLRKLTTFATCQKTNPNLEDSLLQESSKVVYEALKLKTHTPSFFVNNGKAVIILNVINKNKEILEDVTVLLHATKRPTMVYTTKFYQRTASSPSWQELPKAELKPDVEIALAVVIDLTELQYTVLNRVDFIGVISYKRLDKEWLMPFERVMIPYSQIMSKKYEVLSTDDIDELCLLAILATSNKVDISFRMIMNEWDTESPLPAMFSMYLGMHQLRILDNAVIHRSSPYHVLHGVMVVFEEHKVQMNMVHIGLYVRSPDQVLSLMHFIHDSFPFRVIITSRNQKVSTTVESLRVYNEDIPPRYPIDSCYMAYGLSIVKQITMILEYFDNCMMKMNLSNSPEIKEKIGKEIDMFAGGLTEYREFREKLLKEALKGVLCLNCESGPLTQDRME